jgi:hypothetical protein
MGSAAKLSFSNPEFTAAARVIRSSMRSPHEFESGLTFIGTIPPELRSLLEEKVEAAPLPDIFARAPFLNFDGDEEEEEEREERGTEGQEASELPYVECVLTPSGWQRRRVESLIHPKEGFTMLLPDSEGEDDLDLYCRTFEVADDETRRMIRLSFDLAAHARTS